jgi:flagellar hook-length control protein FliK
MIVLDRKQQTPPDASPLSLSPKKETPFLSFASLLQGVEDMKIERKSVQNGLMAVALQEDVVQADSLLENEQTKTDAGVLELNPKITQTRTVQELKAIMHKAKAYIKSQITKSGVLTKQELAALPKTLKGLTQIAKKIGIDISKITLEKVERFSLAERAEKRDTKTLQTDKLHSPNAVDVNDESVQKVQSTKTAHSNAADVGDESVQKAQSTKTTLSNAAESAKHTQRTQAVKSHSVKVTSRADTIQKSGDTHARATSQTLQETPLFTAQTKREISTEELVQAKKTIVKPAQKSKEKNDNILDLLLRGEKVAHSSQKSALLGSDFSVNTAKVTAPKLHEDTTQNLEALLHENKRKDRPTEETGKKSSELHIAKAESFEVKLHEAKQMVKYLSQDIKRAIEEYKSPFARVKVQLNPQKLGEVDLTIVQRGKNLHINLSSNNAAINTLAMNANDLKVQLNNSGINNASLNFNNNSQMSDGSAGSQTQQQQQQKRDDAQHEYSYFTQEEGSEEILSSLEIVVPHYA